MKGDNNKWQNSSKSGKVHTKKFLQQLRVFQDMCIIVPTPEQPI
jgi:hypothetical protein